MSPTINNSLAIIILGVAQIITVLYVARLSRVLKSTLRFNLHMFNEINDGLTGMMVLYETQQKLTNGLIDEATFLNDAVKVLDKHIRD